MKSLNISTRWIYPAQLVICTVFLFLFCNNSLLRPSPGNTFKEYVIGVLLLATCYLNAFFCIRLSFNEIRLLLI